MVYEATPVEDSLVIGERGSRRMLGYVRCVKGVQDWGQDAPCGTPALKEKYVEIQPIALKILTFLFIQNIDLYENI